mmetsp:Transcript_20902/g.39689  ORF Transcript_20902/g.39689 Transcript_20902/m.39689 type:complete len:347 (-) Transcript_20902:157-1197(-)
MFLAHFVLVRIAIVVIVWLRISTIATRTLAVAPRRIDKRWQISTARWRQFVIIVVIVTRYGTIRYTNLLSTAFAFIHFTGRRVVDVGTVRPPFMAANTLVIITGRIMVWIRPITVRTLATHSHFTTRGTTAAHFATTAHGAHHAHFRAAAAHFATTTLLGAHHAHFLVALLHGVVVVVVSVIWWCAIWRRRVGSARISSVPSTRWWVISRRRSVVTRRRSIVARRWWHVRRSRTGRTILITPILVVIIRTRRWITTLFLGHQVTAPITRVLFVVSLVLCILGGMFGSLVVLVLLAASITTTIMMIGRRRLCRAYPLATFRCPSTTLKRAQHRRGKFVWLWLLRLHG